MRVCLEDGRLADYMKPYITREDYEWDDKSLVMIGSSFVWGDVDVGRCQGFLDRYRTDMKDKVVVVFWVTDYEERVDIPHNVRLFRTSIRRSIQQLPNEQVLAYVFDPIQTPFKPFLPAPAPVLSFCGLVSCHRAGLIHFFKQNQDKIQTNFIERDEFWAGRPHDPQVIEEFQQNILQSHFVLSQRGNGNFSMRFYQVLSAGRIPVLLDTDIVLPFASRIDWQQVCVIATTPETLLEKILWFYHTHDIVQTQQKCHTIYQQYFHGKTYFHNLLHTITHTPAK